jgi:hypothetical protein
MLGFWHASQLETGEFGMGIGLPLRVLERKKAD